MFKRLTWLMIAATAGLQAQEPGRLPELGGARIHLGQPLLDFRTGGTFLDQMAFQGFHQVGRATGGTTHRTGLDLSYFPIRWLGVRLALEGDNLDAGQAIPEREGPVRERAGGGVGVIIRF